LPSPFAPIVFALALGAATTAAGGCTRSLELGLGEADAGDTATGDGTDTNGSDDGDTDSDNAIPDAGPDGAIGDGGAD
jgi:hypothetical protein